MRHLSDALLRRMSDDAFGLSDADRQHYTECLRCQDRYVEMGQDAREAAALLAVPAVPVDTWAALDRVRMRVEREGIAPANGLRTWLAAIRTRTAGARRPITALASGIALLAAVTLTPAGSMAERFFTVFQPKQVAVIGVTPGELRSLPDLSKYGTVSLPVSVQSQHFSSADAASRASGMNVLVPGSIPGDVPAKVSYLMAPGTSASFTFSAAKARQASAAAGKPLPPMPARIDGSTLQLTTGNAVVATYSNDQQGMPVLAVGQMKAPTISSTGVSAREIEDYVLGLPGVDPTLAAQIRAIGDPATTLPIPVPVNMAQAHSVQVQGVRGEAIGDSTGIGSLVVWEKAGIMYGVGGTLSEDQVLQIANSLR